MTEIVPSPLTRAARPRRNLGKRRSNLAFRGAESRLASNARHSFARQKRAERAPAGSTQSTAPSQRSRARSGRHQSAMTRYGYFGQNREQQAKRAPSARPQADCRRRSSATKIGHGTGNTIATIAVLPEALRAGTNRASAKIDDALCRRRAHGRRHGASLHLRLPPGVEAGFPKWSRGRQARARLKREGVHRTALRRGFFRALDHTPSGYSLERWPTPRFCRAQPLRMKVRSLASKLALEGMTCAACAARIEKVLNKVPGVSASVNFAAKKLACATGRTR